MVDFLDHITRLLASCNIWLIGDDQQKITLLFKPCQGLCRTRRDPEGFRIVRRIGLSVSNHRLVHYAVTIEKHCALQLRRGYRFPLGSLLLKCRMRHQKMPHNRLKCLRVRRHSVSMDGWNNDANIGDPRCVAAVPPNNSQNTRTHRFCIIECCNEVRAYVTLDAASPYGEHQNRVARLQSTYPEPGLKHRCPAFVVGPCCQFRNVVGRRVALDARQFAKVIDRVRSIARAAANAEDKQASSIVRERWLRETPFVRSTRRPGVAQPLPLQ